MFKAIDRAADVFLALFLLVAGFYCAWQGWHEHPVQPSWWWGFWAYMSASRISLRDILEWK